ncbi:unnamed protein product [Phytophthora fragariaefolia]|uniref:Unnamed protein product n=1 Tax=Phytophthora fragariaefolia TaxID=1490495 RepID=A0A9W7D737_9STRA|nr:unnamed protein product [Phytophthora fragariaefolia]
MPRIPPPNVFRVSPLASEAVEQRLDALDARLSWFYIRLLLLTGVTWAVHAAELVLFVFTRRLVAHNIGMGTYALEALGVGVFLGAALGGPLFGLLSDARGRRSALLLAMTLSLVGLALSAVAKTDYHVIIARIIAGVGLGGELPAATVLVQELSPSRMRGRMVALLEAFTGLGGVVGVALAFGVAPQLGWRVTYLAICGCIMYIGALRFSIPESPRWLASAGRVDEAMVVMEKIELAHGVRPCYDGLKVQEALTPIAAEALPSVAKVKGSAFDRPMHTLVLWLLWTVVAVSSYALGVYVPTLISLSGFNMYAEWGTIALLHGSQIVGCIIASWMLESRGRKQSLSYFATLTSATSILLSYAPWYKFVVIVGTSSVSALLAGTWSCVLAYTPDNYPTSVRARGVSYAFGFSRLGAAGGALVYPHMFDVWLMSVSAITWVFAGVLAATVLGVVMPYGFDPSISGYSKFRATVSDVDLEAGDNYEKEEHPLAADHQLKSVTNTAPEPEEEFSPKRGGDLRKLAFQSIPTQRADLGGTYLLKGCKLLNIFFSEGATHWTKLIVIAMNSIRRRLDSLEAYPSRFLVRLLLVAGFSWALNAAALVLHAFTWRAMLISLAKTRVHVVRLAFHLSRPFGGGLLIGAAIGAPVFGRIADVNGRRWALVLAKSVSILGFLLSVLARRDYEFVLAKTLTGIGIGGELPVATVLVHELAPRALRSRVVALLPAFAGIGAVVALALVLTLEPRFGWRVPYLVICSVMLYVGVLCFRFPKSPRWLVSAKREAEAMAAVENLERVYRSRTAYDHVSEEDTPVNEEPDASVQTDTVVQSSEPSGSAKTVPTPRLWMMWAVLELSGHALGMYIPILISLWGFNIFSRWTTMMLLGVAQTVGSVLASMVVDQIGLKKVLVCCTTSTALVAIAMVHAPWNGPVVVVGMCTISALLAATWSCALVYAATKFSTDTRGRGVGHAFTFSRLSAVIGAWLYPHLFNVWRMSVPVMAWTFAVPLVLATLLVVLPFEESSVRANNIEEISDGLETGDKADQEDVEDMPLVLKLAKSHKGE